ncbi:MAG: hypothetical protein JNJ57_02225 [Saprospiraceae bacterium]|nr:hypothetical protein [Saprospiraceae bacterium]
MKQFVLIFISLFPLSVLCQQLPVDELKQLGMTQAEIDITQSFNGENGVNGNFLLYRRIDAGTNAEQPILNMRYELYTSENKIIPLSQLRKGINDLLYFEFLNDEVVLIETSISSLNQGLEILRFNTKTGESIRSLSAIIPCKFDENCDWIRYQEKKLAFYSTKWQEPGSIYAYDWKKDELKLIVEGIPFAIPDAMGRYLHLSNVMFNKNKNEFFYAQ